MPAAQPSLTSVEYYRPPLNNPNTELPSPCLAPNPPSFPSPPVPAPPSPPHSLQETSQAPTRQTYDTVCLFCDVSGFTALSEAMEQKREGEEGPRGAEGLAMHLNSYFSLMCRLIAADGGDVFKFAGDACIGEPNPPPPPS